MNARVASDVYERLISYPQGSTILLRKGRTTTPNVFELVVSELASKHGLVVRWVQPENSGRSAVYHRDYDMVEEADEVQAYFAPNRVMEGGTGHVVEAALAREKVLFAWTVDAKGHVIRVGEVEPEP